MFRADFRYPEIDWRGVRGLGDVLRHDYERVLDKHFLPTLGKTRLTKITYEKITEITDKL